MCVCIVLFPIRLAQKQYAREHGPGDKTEKPYIHKPSSPSSVGPADSKTGIGVC